MKRTEGKLTPAGFRDEGIYLGVANISPLIGRFLDSKNTWHLAAGEGEAVREQCMNLPISKKKEYLLEFQQHHHKTLDQTTGSVGWRWAAGICPRGLQPPTCNLPHAPERCFLRTCTSEGSHGREGRSGVCSLQASEQASEGRELCLLGSPVRSSTAPPWAAAGTCRAQKDHPAPR